MEYTLSTYLLGEEGFTTSEKTNLKLDWVMESLALSILLLHLLFQIHVVAFDRCKPFDSNFYDRKRPIPHSAEKLGGLPSSRELAPMYSLGAIGS